MGVERWQKSAFRGSLDGAWITSIGMLKVYTI